MMRMISAVTVQAQEINRPFLPGPPSTIGRMSAYNASDLSFNTGETSLVPVAEKMRNLNFSNFLFNYENWNHGKQILHSN